MIKNDGIILKAFYFEASQKQIRPQANIGHRLDVSEELPALIDYQKSKGRVSILDLKYFSRRKLFFVWVTYRNFVILTVSININYFINVFRGIFNQFQVGLKIKPQQSVASSSFQLFAMAELHVLEISVMRPLHL